MQQKVPAESDEVKVKPIPAVSSLVKCSSQATPGQVTDHQLGRWLL